LRQCSVLGGFAVSENLCGFPSRRNRAHTHPLSWTILAIATHHGVNKLQFRISTQGTE
jgi:hypothetical protein